MEQAGHITGVWVAAPSGSQHAGQLVERIVGSHAVEYTVGKDAGEAIFLTLFVDGFRIFQDGLDTFPHLAFRARLEFVEKTAMAPCVASY